MNKETKIINVLYVDDELHNLQAFNAGFRRDFNVYTASSAAEAEVILKQQLIHILITDQRMPKTLGTELLAEAVKKYPDQIRILLTAYTDVDAIIDAINRGHIFKYLKKPWDSDLIKKAVLEGYEIFVLKEKEVKLREELQKTIDELVHTLKQ
jgi:response regulator RpfG family c-di-GMP phosphodiesterase